MSYGLGWKGGVILAMAATPVIAAALWIGAAASGVRARGAIAIAAALATIGFFLVCEAVSAQLAVPLPAPVVGLVGMAAALSVCRPAFGAMGDVFDRAAPYMPLLFVPAGIGVLAAADVFVASWAPLALAITLGTAATLVLTGILAQILFATLDARAPEPAPEPRHAA